MQEQDDGLTPAARELEAALHSLTPAPAQIDPVAAAFAAGCHSSRMQIRLWRGAAAVLLLISAVSAGSWMIPMQRELPGSAERPGSIAHVAATDASPWIASTPPPPQLSRQSLLILQEQVREKGVDALPATHLPDAPTMRTRGNL